ncbi:MAG: thermitase [Thermoleophilaceae bacterium]|jgi:subtilisin family serine protease|nr:thermitase [Thermoleophilaceae bacterium]
MGLALTLVLAILLAAAPAQAAPPAASGRLLVGFKHGVSADRQQRLLATFDGRIAQRFESIRGGRLVVVRPRSGRATDALRKRLASSPEVAYAEADFFQFATKTPDDPFYALQYALVDSPGDHDIDAPTAWGTRSSCAKVAILDTGIDTDHPDLKSNVYKSEDKPNNGKDDDKNGYVDDTYGYNAIKGKGSGEDDNGHGTHVSGIVGGRGNNDVGVSGTCWSTKLLAVKFMNSKGKGSTSDAIEGIDYAVKQGFKIINCSFGSSSKSSALHDAVDYAQDHNTLLVVAAGNDSENIDKHPLYPASYGDSNILAVAATTSSDALASFSNFGSEAVDVAAPGDSIYSTYLGGGYRILSGTSMAAPYAAGVAALLRKQEPDATYGNLRYAIRHKVDKPPALDGKVAYDGRLNAEKALAAIASIVNGN